MAKTLWDFYDGEPFMQNPPLGILTVNAPGTRQPSRKRGKKMAVRRRKRRMTAKQRRYFGKGRKRSPVRRRRSSHRRRRGNPWAVPGMVVAANPRRRRRGRKHSVRRRRGHRRSNPALLGFSMPPVKSIAFAAVGFAGPSLVSGFLTQTFPSIMQQTTALGTAGKYITKIGSVLGLAWLTRRFVGSNESHMVLIGGAANIALTLVNDFAPGFLPANPLSMYVPVAGGMRGMRAYVPTRPNMRALPTVDQSTFNRGSDIPTAAPFRSFSKFGVAQRYFRY